MKTGNTKAAGYIRVSDESQVDASSLAAQEFAIRRYCETHGYDLIRIYREEGVSAHTDRIEQRPEFAALLCDAEASRFDIVVVHTIDRWARRVSVQAQALERLGRARVGFVSITENFDYTTPAGRFMLTMLGGASEFFSDQLSVHVSKAQHYQAEQGFVVGPVPFGARRDADGEVVIVEREAGLVAEAFERRASGQSNGEIARWLNEQGVRTRTGRLFTAHAVKDMLNCRFYAGGVIYKGEEYPGRHPAIVSEEMFQRVRARRIGPRRARPQVAGASGALHGRLYCGRCGNPVQSDRDARGAPRYRERHGWECPTNGRTRAAQHIDAQISAIIAAVELEPEWKRRIYGLATSPAQEGSYAFYEAQLRRLARAYADGAFSDREYAGRKAALDARLAAAENSDTIDFEQVATLLDDITTVWKEATTDERGRLVAPLIERAYVDLEAKRIGALTPTPAFRTLLERAVRKSDSAAAVLVSPADLGAAVWRGGDGGESNSPSRSRSAPDMLQA